MKFEIHSIEETQNFAQKIARLCQGKEHGTARQCDREASQIDRPCRQAEGGVEGSRFHG